MAGRIVQPHIDAGRAAHAVAGEPEVLQRLDHRLFDAEDVLLDEDAQAFEIHQRIGHHLTRPVVGHLPAAVALHHRDVAGFVHVLGLAGHALGVDARVFAQPELVGRVGAAGLGERPHGLEAGEVIDAAQDLTIMGRC